MLIIKLIAAAVLASGASAFVIPTMVANGTLPATFDYPVIDGSLHSLTKRSGSGTLKALDSWIEYGRFRQTFQMSGIQCSDVKDEFDHDWSTIPNAWQRNFQCKDYQPGQTETTFDISARNNDAGRKNMACALQDLIIHFGDDSTFCSAPGICCWHWKWQDS